MPIRYSDTALKIDKKATDFVSRKYNPSVLLVIMLFFGALIVGIGVTSLLLTPFQMIVALTIVMGALGLFVIIELQRLRDMVVAAEYQNAMFASALGYNSKFCIIIKREGTVVYMNGGLYKMFPDLSRERQPSISNLLKMAKVGTVEREKVLDMIQRGVEDRMALDLRSSDNRTHQLMLTVKPIARPSGFLIIRGRDFVEERSLPKGSAAPMVNPLLSKSSIAMFANIMDRMGMGLYMIDMGGNMLYANPMLENWLSFGDGEITAGNFTMRDVVQGVTVEDALNPGDFEGENSLLKKQGGIIKAYINQKIIYGDNNKPLGCVALITNIVESDSELKKRLW